VAVAILVALGKGAFRATHPAFFARTVFGVRVAAVVQLNTGFVKLKDAKSVKFEMQQRLWPRLE
jgi:hypothetical protein